MCKGAAIDSSNSTPHRVHVDTQGRRGLSQRVRGSPITVGWDMSTRIKTASQMAEVLAFNLLAFNLLVSLLVVPLVVSAMGNWCLCS